MPFSQQTRWTIDNEFWNNVYDNELSISIERNGGIALDMDIEFINQFKIISNLSKSITHHIIKCFTAIQFTNAWNV